MDTLMTTEISTSNEADPSDINRLKTELADARFELNGCRDTVERLSSEIRRLRQRFHAESEGDWGPPS